MDRYPDDGQISPEFKRHNSSVKRLDRSGCRSLNCAQFRAKCRLNSARIVTEQGAPVQIRRPCGSYRKIRQLRPFPHHSPSPDYRNHGTDTRASQMIARRVRRGKCPDCNRRRLDGSPISWNAHDSSVSQLIGQPVMQGASKIIAYPPGSAGVSPAPRVADKIGREARQKSWIHPPAEPVTCQN